MDQIIVFGTGNLWEQNKEYIYEYCSVVVLLDNNPKKWTTKIDGIQVENPQKLSTYRYDYILIMSTYVNEMRDQLLLLGVEESKIINWSEFAEKFLKEKVLYYNCQPTEAMDIVLITQYMNYSGGTMVALYAAQALQMRGKKVLICTEKIQKELLEEYGDTTRILIVPALPRIGETLRTIINRCECVMVNVFTMLPVAVQLYKLKPTLWWIHENKVSYEPVMKRYPDDCDLRSLTGITIKSVSRVAAENFECFFPGMKTEVMTYGIPDEGSDFLQEKKPKISVALVGSIMERKGQDILLAALDKLNEKERKAIEIFFVGNFSNDKYGQNIKRLSESFENVTFTGNLNRKDLHQFYNTVDVVVCASRAETMSLAITEAMMYGKACITTDETGIADYIVDGENGLICKTEDALDLRDKLRYLIHHRQMIPIMGEKNRKVYEQQFSMNCFADRLMMAIEETISNFAGE